MPPPKYNTVKKRRAKRAAEYLNPHGRTGHRSVPTTPNQSRSANIHSLSEHPQTESDSDTAGFDSNWKWSNVFLSDAPMLECLHHPLLSYVSFACPLFRMQFCINFWIFHIFIAVRIADVNYKQVTRACDHVYIYVEFLYNFCK